MPGSRPACLRPTVRRPAAPPCPPRPARPAPSVQAFLGDTTWTKLFPTQFSTALPFPCFNIKDLHTVDDGVWAHLLPTLRRGSGDSRGGEEGHSGGDRDSGGSGGGGAGDGWGWDVLVAHYLGVDHAGHAHRVGSEEMVAKLRQMDDHIRQVGGAGGRAVKTRGPVLCSAVQCCAVLCSAVLCCAAGAGHNMCACSRSCSLARCSVLCAPRPAAQPGPAGAPWLAGAGGGGDDGGGGTRRGV